jgi:hypothetical protein
MKSLNRKVSESGRIAYPLLSIFTVLVCSAVVFAQSGSGQEHGLEHRVSALEAALANIQNPPARVLVASDFDGTDDINTIYRPTQVHLNTMPDYINVNGTTGVITATRPGVYRIFFKAYRNAQTGIAQILVNDEQVDYEADHNPLFAPGTQSELTIRLAVGDAVTFNADQVMGAGLAPSYSRVEMEYLGS